MPEISESANVNYCASVLAKAVKLNNETAFSSLHDALGKLFDTKQLKKVEDLARTYTQLPIHILDTKISWLQPKVKPLDLTAYLNPDVGNVAEIKAAKQSGDTPAMPQMNNQAANLRSEPQTTKKKKNALNKAKQNDETVIAEQADKIVKREIQTEDATAIEEPEQPTPTLLTKQRKKKKNKKKLKSVKKKNENEQQEKQDTKTPEPIECKSPEEVTVSAPDSGIGSCVASGGEDKSSVLSGGTVESNGEHTEPASPLFNFEWEVESSVVNDFLLTEKVFVEHNDKNTAHGEDAKKRNHYEISFGEPFIADTNESKLKLKLASKAQKRKTTAKNVSDKNIQKSVNSDVKDTECFDISFGTPVKTSKKAVTMPTDAPKKEPKSPKQASNNSTFDHQGAVLFLCAEWNRTVKGRQV